MCIRDRLNAGNDGGLPGVSLVNDLLMDGLSKVFSGIIGISDLCVRLDIQSGGKQNVDLLFQRSLIDVNGVCLDQDALPNNRHIRGGNMLQKPADAGTDEVPHIVLVALTVLDVYKRQV